MSYLKVMALFAALALAMYGCGGDSSDESMSEKNYIVILKNVPSGVCESSIYRDTLKDYGFKGLKTEETEAETSCETYGKTNDGQYCAEADYDAGDVNCVVGFNEYSGNYDDLSFRKSNASADESSDLDIVTSTLTEAMQKAEK